MNGAVLVSANYQTITFTPAAKLAANTSYDLVLNGVTDLAGNTIASFDITFTTGSN